MRIQLRCSTGNRPTCEKFSQQWKGLCSETKDAKDLFDGQTTEDEKEQVPNLPVAKASQHEWPSSSDSEDEIPAVRPVRVHLKSSIPILVSDIHHPAQPRVHMNSKRKRHPEPLYRSASRSPKKPRRIRPKPSLLQASETITPMPDFTQFTARDISRTIRDAVSYSDISDINSRLRYNEAPGTFNSGIGPLRGNKGGQTEPSKWFHRRDVADYVAVYRAMGKAKGEIPFNKSIPQEADQMQTDERRRLLDQRFREGKSSGYFISQLMGLANQSGVSDRAMLGLLLQERAARETFINVFSDTIGVDDSGNLSVVDDNMAGDLEADLLDAKGWDFDHE